MSAPLLHDCDWLALYLCCLYEQDGMGRLTAGRTPGRAVPPRFVLLRSRHGNLWRFAAGEDPACVRELSRLAGKEPAIRVAAPAPWSEPERLEAMRRVLAGSGPLQAEWRGPIFRFPVDPAARTHRHALGEAVERIAAADPELSRSLALDFPDARSGLETDRACFGVRAGGRWLSRCRSVCGDPNVAVLADVETTPPARRRGLALRCVSAWAEHVLQQGGRPLYAASWANRPACDLALRLALDPYGEECWLA